MVQDQSHKFETDELFRKLSEDTEVGPTDFTLSLDRIVRIYRKYNQTCETMPQKLTLWLNELV